MVRTALTTEVWEDLPAVLGEIRRHSALVRGALHGTMLRNDIFDFTQMGIALERADNTARIIDVKYYTLLPSASFVGSALDNVQWETILRSVSAPRSFRWLNDENMTPASVADFLILDPRFPRSLSFCSRILEESLGFLAKDYGTRLTCHDMISAQRDRLREHTIATVFDEGLHQFITAFIDDINAIGQQIEKDYRFIG